MDEDRRARLIEKRRLAQLRRKRAQVSAAFRRSAPALREAGVRCSKLVPERCRAVLGGLAAGPGQDERPLWAPIPNGTCRTWEDESERDSLLREALSRCARPEEKMAVVWHPFETGLRSGPPISPATPPSSRPRAARRSGSSPPTAGRG